MNTKKRFYSTQRGQRLMAETGRETFTSGFAFRAVCHCENIRFTVMTEDKHLYSETSALGLRRLYLKNSKQFAQRPLKHL